ncbi:hypothetical protein GCM10009754_15570 [Amycolatopsis minnesotensis]|uniref:Uncharacterized protein n=1 Tax=Amycolatopsis minnesotensis TaxID=337894 RepID=A0ABP5BNY7_9PSEU
MPSRLSWIAAPIPPNPAPTMTASNRGAMREPPWSSAPGVPKTDKLCRTRSTLEFLDWSRKECDRARGVI